MTWFETALATVSQAENLLFLFIIAVYFGITEVARRHVIQPFFSEYLQSRIAIIQARLTAQIERDGIRSDEEVAVKGQVEKLLSDAKHCSERTTALYLPWTGAYECTAYDLSKEAELLSVDIVPPETTRRLLLSKKLLLEDGDDSAKLLARRIDSLLSATDSPARDTASRELLKEVISREQLQADGSLDLYFTVLAKVGLLIGLGVLLIVPLGLIFGNLHLFLFGAVGGLLVPLGRIVRSKEMPTSYDFYWPNLLLMPLLGAFSGWVGVLLIDVFSAQGASVLGDVFKNVEWSETSTNKETLVAALFMGFASEWLEKLMRSPEDDPKPAKKDG